MWAPRWFMSITLEIIYCRSEGRDVCGGGGGWGEGGVKHMCHAEALLNEWGVQKRANDAECFPLTAYRDQV